MYEMADHLTITRRIEHITVDGVEQKRCYKCETYKPLESFGKSKHCWDNLCHTCKDCLREVNAARKDYTREYNKKYLQANKEAKKLQNAQWREANRDKYNAYSKKWYAANKDQFRATTARYRKRMKAEGGDKFVNFTIRSNISSRIRAALGQQKSEASSRYTGCSLPKLRASLESTFQDHMSFRNFNRMHIDHRIPCAAFDMSNPVERKACFHYKNLQMLWAPDNLRKSARYDPEDKARYMKKFVEIYVIP